MSKTSADAPTDKPRAPDYPKPPFPPQAQKLPGSFRKMDPRPDPGEESWRGAGRLEGMVALITGGDDGGQTVSKTAHKDS